MLELKNICAGYGDRRILDNVTVTVEKGRLTSVIGVNGCGKSTLLKTMLGILPVLHGSVEIDGCDLRSMNRNEIAKKISYLPQGKNTPDMTVEQMVLHGRFPYLSYPRRYRSIDREIARDAINSVGISHLADTPLYALSSGMRQNAYIAMALAQDTDYILLDEPTTYLDISNQLELMKLLKRLAEAGKGIIAVMHDLPLALRFSNDLIVIENGGIRAKTTPSELCATSIVSEIFKTQIKSVDGNYYYDI